MSKSVNDEKKTRSIKVVDQLDFLKVVNEVKEILNAEDFENVVCEKTGNGLYKFTTTCPNDKTGVKDFEADGLKWYKVPTTDYRISLTSYLQYRLTAKAKAVAAAKKELSDLSLEELRELIALRNAAKK